jgi:hypothetical protein
MASLRRRAEKHDPIRCITTDVMRSELDGSHSQNDPRSQDPRGKEMSSGAYALFVDQPAGAGPNAPIQRVIPLIPVNHLGGIPFNNGWLSLAYDNFGTGPATVDVRVRVLNSASAGGIRLDTTVSIPVGRTAITVLASNDHAASLTVTGPAGARPALTALVEFDD